MSINPNDSNDSNDSVDSNDSIVQIDINEYICPLTCQDYCRYLNTNPNLAETNNVDQHYDDLSVKIFAIICCPIKFVLFIPCLIGCSINSTINCVNKKNKNYLC